MCRSARRLFVFSDARKLRRRDGGLQKSLPDPADSRFRGVQQVFRIETVIPQFVQQDLVGGEVRRSAAAREETVQGQQERRLGQLVLMRPVAQVPDGADGEDVLRTAARRADPLQAVQHLRLVQALVHEFRGGTFQAVRHHLAVVAQPPDKGGSEGHDELGAALPEGCRPGQGTVGVLQEGRCIRTGEGAVVAPRADEFRPGAHLHAVRLREGVGIRQAFHGLCDGSGVVQGAERIDADLEACGGQTRSDPVREAAAQHQYAVFQADLHRQRRTVYGRRKFHTVFNSLQKY